jgi:hypothetical protein
MELLFLILLIVIMAISLGVGFPVAFALPGSAIITIGMAAFFGYIFENDFGAFFIWEVLPNGCQLVLRILEVFIGKLKEIH